jgi:hypothetical protein
MDSTATRTTTADERCNLTAEARYRQFAAECLWLARSEIIPDNKKALFLEMAQDWLQLADRADARAKTNISQ